MITQTDGLILRQTKIADDRRMLTLLTRKFGKISAGAGIGSGKSRRSQLAVKAFTHGRYEIFTGRNSYSINSGEVVRSFYDIGEDVEKYALASYALELTDRMLPENMVNERALDLLLKFLSMLIDRRKSPMTLLTVYKWKLLDICGFFPRTDCCSSCGSKEGPMILSVVDGGLLCGDCRKARPGNMRLLYRVGSDTINTLEYIRNTDFEGFEKLVLNSGTEAALDEIYRAYISYHLEIESLKSESFLGI